MRRLFVVSMAFPERITTDRLVLAPLGHARRTRRPGGGQRAAGRGRLPQRRRPVHARGVRAQSERFAEPLGDARLRPRAPPSSRDTARSSGSSASPTRSGSRTMRDEVEVGWRLHPAHGATAMPPRPRRAVRRPRPGSTSSSTRIISIIDPRNAPSIAVAQRLGMALDVTVPHPQRPGDVTIWQTVAAVVDRGHQRVEDRRDSAGVGGLRRCAPRRSESFGDRRSPAARRPRAVRSCGHRSALAAHRAAPTTAGVVAALTSGVAAP